MAQQSAMFTPRIFEPSAASLSRAPRQSGQVANVTARSTNARTCGCMDSRSLLRIVRCSFGIRPSYVTLVPPMVSFVVGLCRKSCSCCSVNSAIGLSAG